MESRLLLRNKKIILGVTGCIAAYKAVEIMRSLQKLGADVWVVMTGAAQEFVSPLTFRTLSGNPCITGMFSPENASMPLPHIALSESADLLLIAPATADIIGKAASGIGDDILSTLIMSCGCPKVAAPAMNTKMWNNKAVRENIRKIKALGFSVVDPVEGLLACGETGEGHLAQNEAIIKKAIDLAGIRQDLSGKKVLVTAGGTREPIDPVRYIGNRSSGKMGYAVAQAAYDRGAEVTIVSAPTSIKPPSNVNIEPVNTAGEMKDAVLKKFKDCDILVMAAAVADYQPATLTSGKIKKSREGVNIELKPTDDILLEVSKKKGKKIVVGFSVESQDLVANSKKKLKSKDLDIIVANSVAAFERDESSAVIINKKGKMLSLPKQRKEITANIILDCVLSLSESQLPVAGSR